MPGQLAACIKTYGIPAPEPRIDEDREDSSQSVASNVIHQGGEVGLHRKQTNEGDCVNPEIAMPEVAAAIYDEWHGKTTALVRNVPFQCTPEMFAAELNSVGLMNTFDYVYLPMEHEGNRNRGYAFVNFVAPMFALRFVQVFSERMLRCGGKQRRLSITPAHLQGYQTNANHASVLKSLTWPSGSFEATCPNTLGSSETACSVPFGVSLEDESNDATCSYESSELQAEHSLTQTCDHTNSHILYTGETSVQVETYSSYCPECGSGVLPGARFCRMCGRKLAIY